ncbi:MAG: hypothetical protein M1833_006094 [Piccolia ochrophora]|nr:MAG: hypothetical protein M1833_006094 [Piccolia ochrophora]
MVEPSSTTDTSFSSGQRGSSTTSQSNGADKARSKVSIRPDDVKGLDDAVKDLTLEGGRSSSAQKKISDDQGAGATKDDEVAYEDGQQTSISEISTKPPSLDGKSVTSGTTFALDEKESLRPDDSASVKAAEDDDRFSGIGSGADASRVGSEAGARAFRDQFHEISARMGYSPQAGAESVTFEPLPGSSDLGRSNFPEPGADGGGLTAAGSAAVPFGYDQGGPDEKLLEALESPKDRLFLLRLEQEVIDFVKDSKEPLMDLAPCNSFCRLLIHKLADYYFLSHFVDANNSSVRIFRTPFCRLPPPLTGISNPPTSANTPPPTGPAMKIMRRGASAQQARTLPDKRSGTGFEEPSKSTSTASEEDGGAHTDNDIMTRNMESTIELVVGKEKGSMTREEREAKYKEARERIFKGFGGGEHEDENGGNEEGKQISRSSSSAEKNVSSGRKQRHTNDDGFEARSQYAAFYPPNQYSTQAYPGPSSYGSYSPQPSAYGSQVPGMSQFNAQGSYNPSFSPNLAPSPMQPYPISPSQFPSGAPMNASQPPVSFSGYDQSQHQPGFHSQHSPSPFLPLSSPAPHAHPQAPAPAAQWPHHYPNPYVQPAPHQAHGASNMMSSQMQPPSHGPGISYPFGQLPNQHHGSQSNPHHPIPGSFNRHAFNPQTQSFVPGGHPSSQVASYGAPQPFLNGMNFTPQQFGNNMQLAFNTAHGHFQGQRSTSQYNSPPSSRPNSSKHSPNAPPPNNTVQANKVGDANYHPMPNTLAKWGTPANLPPKPPAPAPSVQHSLLKENNRPLPAKSYSGAVKNGQGISSTVGSLTQDTDGGVRPPMGVQAGGV